MKRFWCWTPEGKLYFLLIVCRSNNPVPCQNYFHGHKLTHFSSCWYTSRTSFQNRNINKNKIGLSCVLFWFTFDLAYFWFYVACGVEEIFTTQTKLQLKILKELGMRLDLLKDHPQHNHRNIRDKRLNGNLEQCPMTTTSPLSTPDLMVQGQETGRIFG